MGRLLAWWRDSRAQTDGFIRAGVAHLWFAAIHPFEDGNGRIARTLTDTALAQDELSSKRFFSLSSQIMREQEAYYDAIKETNFSHGDITRWLVWFLECAARAMEHSDTLLIHILRKSNFWQRHAQTVLNQQQIKVVNRLLNAGPEGFEGGLKNRKYVGITKTSRATAQREQADLVKMGILAPRQAGVRNVTYDLILK